MSAATAALAALLRTGMIFLQVSATAFGNTMVAEPTASASRVKVASALRENWWSMTSGA